MNKRKTDNLEAKLEAANIRIVQLEAAINLAIKAGESGNLPRAMAQLRAVMSKDQ